MKTIKAKRLAKIGFTKNDLASVNGKTVYDNLEFRVTLFKDRKEYPIISVAVPVFETKEHVETEIAFPGAHTMKHLTDLMFFYYGEKRMSEITEGWEIRIVKIKDPLSDLLKTVGLDPDYFDDKQRTSLLQKFRTIASEYIESVE